MKTAEPLSISPKLNEINDQITLLSLLRDRETATPREKSKQAAREDFFLVWTGIFAISTVTAGLALLDQDTHHRSELITGGAVGALTSLVGMIREASIAQDSDATRRAREYDMMIYDLTHKSNYFENPIYKFKDTPEFWGKRSKSHFPVVPLTRDELESGIRFT